MQDPGPETGVITPSFGAVEGPTAFVKALLVTDLVESTAIVQRLGDGPAAEVFGRHDRLARDLLISIGGQEIDKTDGFLLVFDRPLEAVLYALAYQEALANLSKELGVDLQARTGIHLGEIVQRRNSPQDVVRGAKPLEVEGLAKPTAARIMSLARPGQILLSRSAFDLARRALVGDETYRRELRWLAHGSFRFQGVTDAEEIFEVGLEGLSPLIVPADTPKARREVVSGEEITLGWRPAPGLELPLRAHWFLKERLGEGAFGEVWLAAHEKTGEKRVFKFCFQPERLYALRREVTVFRLLKEVLGAREDIARILDWNFDEAPYFLEAEYTEGGSLLHWVQGQGGTEALPLATRLELVAQVADALAAAHSIGVLHKDVKPANILITADINGEPKARLTDFGIGLITDAGLLAAQGITAVGLSESEDLGTSEVFGGTALYMAPELVAGGAASVQGDIYALGVTLYQLVAGDLRRPLAPGWRREIDDDLLAEDIACFVDGSPERRPSSAAEVAQRLRSLPERRQRLQTEQEAEERRRRARRWWKVARTAGVLGTVFLVVVSVLAWKAFEARREADHRRRQAEDLVGFMLGDLWEGLEPRTRLEVMEGVGDKARQYLESIPAEELTLPERFRWSKALSQLGQVRVTQGRLSEAQVTLVRSRELYESLVAAEADNGVWLKGYANCRFWIGQVLRRQGKLTEALDEFEGYRQIAQELVKLDPQDREWRLELAFGHANVGTLHRELGNLDRALAEHQKARALKIALAGEDPENQELLWSLSASENTMGLLYEQAGSLNTALKHYREQFRLVSELVKADPGNITYQRSLGASENYLGTVLLALGEEWEAERLFRSTLERLEPLAKRDSDNGDLVREVAIHRWKLGRTLLERSASEALEQLDSARRELARLAEGDATHTSVRRSLAGVQIDRADLLRLQGRNLDASVALEAAGTLLGTEADREPNPERLREGARLELVRGQLLASSGSPEKAKGAWRRGLELSRSQNEEKPFWQTLATEAELYLRLGERKEARRIIQRLHDQGFKDPTFVRMLREMGETPYPA